MADPPLEAGGVKDIVACPLPGVAVPMVGAPGAPAGVTLTLPDAAPVPTALVAFALQLYVVPLVSPVTVIGLAAPLAVNAPQVAV